MDEEGDKYLSGHVDFGHIEADRILTLRGVKKKLEEKVGEENRIYATFYKEMKNLNVNPNNLFEDPAGKVKHIINYLKIFKLKDKKGHEIDIYNCNDLTIGRNFLNFYNKGKNFFR